LKIATAVSPLSTFRASPCGTSLKLQTRVNSISFYLLFNLTQMIRLVPDALRGILAGALDLEFFYREPH